ncbi:hypothetical protein E5K00_20880 [Hymenobacter aquaticus]|uniref:Uncharacterized protein n=1 Tax=Hymenobacter aquaticus TaxID=1867101 RepID=A0A4Z0PT22_9BACT|nr:hypothetical protein [Hymenobacter aquaticus]TGE20454.1 hypothetical protein E5K00_20880 [Hymenobacter aquaticus]
MHFSTRIRQAVARLESIATMPAEQERAMLVELQHCAATEVQSLIDHHSTKALREYLGVRLFIEAQVDELPVSAYSVAEFRRRINYMVLVWNASKDLPPFAGRDLRPFLETVNGALYQLAVYTTGWSEKIQLEALEAWYSETDAEIIICDVGQCWYLSGEGYFGDSELRPATKSELIARNFYDYYQDLD